MTHASRQMVEAGTRPVIDVVELHHDLLCCRVNSHQWVALSAKEQAKSGQDFECTECDARGVLVRPMGVGR